MSKKLLRVFRAPQRAPVAPPPPRPLVLSPAEAARRNYARMEDAAMVRRRRSIDGR